MSKATRTRKAKKRRKTRIIGGACKARKVSNSRQAQEHIKQNKKINREYDQKITAT